MLRVGDGATLDHQLCQTCPQQQGQRHRDRAAIPAIGRIFEASAQLDGLHRRAGVMLKRQAAAHRAEQRAAWVQRAVTVHHIQQLDVHVGVVAIQRRLDGPFHMGNAVLHLAEPTVDERQELNNQPAHGITRAASGVVGRAAKEDLGTAHRRA